MIILWIASENKTKALETKAAKGFITNKQELFPASKTAFELNWKMLQSEIQELEFVILMKWLKHFKDIISNNHGENANVTFW